MTTDVEAFPLSWPLGWPRTEPRRRQRANFSRQVQRSFAVVRDELLAELRLLGVSRTSIVLSTNIPLRKDGLPYANMRQPDDPGVAVYFALDGEPKCIPCDKWDRIEDNMRAVSLTINALRGLERWGAKHMVEAAFAGFAALPAAASTLGWWDVLGIARDAGLDEVQRAYRARLRETHPDTGGDAEAFHRIQDAWTQFAAERKR